MKSEELEVDILKMQNRQMSIKIQYYRTENQELKSKNQELNLWVANLSEVFSTVSASWESITILEETLLNLMKKRTDMKDRTSLRKYQFHFKTFVDIITNLSEKIKNTGHSQKATEQAKEQLLSFVKNYELLFKQFLQTYFKFNDEYNELISTIKNRDDTQQNMRLILTKTTDQTQKIKEFQSYFQSLKENFKVCKEYNNEKLLEKIVQKKEQEIQKLKDNLKKVERRMRIMFDYNSVSISSQIDSKQEDYECVCGGTQLAYMKKTWQQKLKNFEQLSIQKQDEESKGVKSESVQVLQSKMKAMEQQKKVLIARISLLVEKNSKISMDYKLTQEMVLRSSVYLSLKEQCQYLLGYVTELISKIKKQQQNLFLIQKARDQEIKEMKKKLEKVKSSEQRVGNGAINNFNNSFDIFKTDCLSMINTLTNTYIQIGQKRQKSEETLRSFKQKFDLLKKSNDELNKRVGQFQAKELGKTQKLEFKHQKFKEIETEVHKIIEKESSSLIDLWKEFIQYVKGRDKKIKDMQSMLRKKDREIEQKNNLQQMMKKSLDETENIYNQNKGKLDKTVQFFKNMQEELARLAEENYKVKRECEEEKVLLNLRLTAETQARNKLEEKVSSISKIEAQFQEIKGNQKKLIQNYENWLETHKKQFENCAKELREKQILLKNTIDESAEKDKKTQKLQTEKETLKSQTRELKNRVEALMSTTQNEVLKMELNQYKDKIMCKCTGDRERQVVLKSCPHLFCKRCIEDTTNNRNRKCPQCGIKFTKTDVHEIKWN